MCEIISYEAYRQKLGLESYKAKREKWIEDNLAHMWLLVHDKLAGFHPCVAEAAMMRARMDLEQGGDFATAQLAAFDNLDWSAHG
jgi:hypothetical protein